MVWKLRGAQSGPVFRGETTGQALVWNEELDGWEAGTPTSPNVYQFATYQDLEDAFPAVGGVHTLDDGGVYQFVGAGFSLGANVIAVTGDGAIVQGQGNTQLSGDATLGLLRLQGVGQTLQNIRVRNTADNASLDRCGVECTGGLATLINCRIEAEGSACGLIVGGTANVVGDGVEFREGNSANVRYVSGDLTLVAPRFTGGSGPAILVDSDAGSSVVVSDAHTIAAKSHGILVDGSLTSILSSNCNWGAPTGAGIARQSGTVGAVSIMGGRVAGDIGVLWASANAPTRGLAIVGVDVASATPFDGFTAASARVNVKACVGAAGLLDETAIVA